MSLVLTLFCKDNTMFPSAFWLILGIINFVVAVLPPYSPMSLINLALAVWCFYIFAQTQKEENDDL